jgi:hypothetical protein
MVETAHSWGIISKEEYWKFWKIWYSDKPKVFNKRFIKGLRWLDRNVPRWKERLYLAAYDKEVRDQKEFCNLLDNPNVHLENLCNFTMEGYG